MKTHEHGSDGSSSTLRYQLAIQRSRIIFYNGAWLIGAAAKGLGFLSFSWPAALAFLAVANLNIIVCMVLYRRGIGRVAGMPLTVIWMAFDTLIITWAIAMSGGSQSALYPWYLTTAAAAAYFGGRRGLWVVIIADTLAFLGLIVVTEGLDPTTLATALGKMMILFGAAGYALLAIWRLQQKRTVISDLRAQDARRAAELETAIGTISKSADRLSTAAEELFGVSRTMTRNAESTAAEAGGVSSAVDRVSEHVQSVAAAVEELSYGVREIAQLAREAAGVANNAVEEAESAHRIIAQLASSSNEIGSVIETISSVADQTRLLALNASIEAARAGSAGRGFAVVASEVKSLADETAGASGEVGSQITAIQTDARAVVEAIDRIGGIITRINELQTTIAGAVEEQTATTAEISRSMTDAAQGGGEISRRIAAVAGAAGETSSGAVSVERAASELTRLAEELGRGGRRRGATGKADG
ncbi:MAG: methyl-accepting chemotaxis protein [Thermoanaerobaculales bacterium]|nr:methyl-accepting chemotaxis protein [Thermoanaerobaculales bacterium]